MQTEALVKTQAGETYLAKLCRHFAHKVPATVQAGRGIIEFPFGRCRIDAAADHLRLSIDLEDRAEVAGAEQVLAEHLQRMARREDLDVQWVRSGD